MLWPGLLIVCQAANVCAQGTAKAAERAAPGAHTIGSVTVKGSVRTRIEAWDWFQAGSGDNSYAYSGNLFRLSLSQARESLDWQVEFAMPLLAGLPANAIAPGTQGQLGAGASYFAANDRSRNAAMLFPKLAFARFKKLGASTAQSLTVGRFEFSDGSEIAPKDSTMAAVKRDRINQRLIGSFGWAHAGRSFDGFHHQWNRPSGNFTLVGAVPTRGVFQTDGWGWNKTAFGYAAYTLPWRTGSHSAETRLLAIHYRDWRRVLKADNRALAARQADLGNIRVASFGGHHISVLQTGAGAVDVMLWGVAQTGRWGSLNHRAAAIAAEAGIQPRVWTKLKPWIRGGFFDGSGDGDPNDGTHGTFFQLLPTPRPFARFPFFNLMNNRDVNAMLIFRPHSKVSVSTEFHALRLSNRRDLWYSGGGVFQPWTFGYAGRATSGARSLANLYDASVEYRPSQYTTLTGYLGYAHGRAATSAIYPDGKNGALGYLDLTVRF
jgi:hypothetical protein